MIITPEMILTGMKMEMDIHYPRAGFIIGAYPVTNKIVLSSKDSGIMVEVVDNSIQLYRVCRTEDMACLIHDGAAFKKLMTRMKFLAAKYYGRSYNKIEKDALFLTAKEKRWLIQKLSEGLDKQEKFEAERAKKLEEAVTRAKEALTQLSPA